MRRIEALGYPSLWISEAPGGKEVFAHLAMLLGTTERMLIAPGIANIRSREPAVMQAGAVTLAEAYPDRFLLGLGGTGREPTMRDYLAAMAEAARSPVGPFMADPGVHVMDRMAGYLTGDFPLAPTPPPSVTTVLAALGPRPGCWRWPERAPTAPTPTRCRSRTPPWPAGRSVHGQPAPPRLQRGGDLRQPAGHDRRRADRLG